MNEISAERTVREWLDLIINSDNKDIVEKATKAYESEKKCVTHSTVEIGS